MKSSSSIGAIGLSILTAASLLYAQGEFREPWTRPDRGIVLDPYQGNPIDWDAVGTDRSVVGVIHRASIGKRADTKYVERRTKALERGYRWGSYHLGRKGDPQGQADFYLQAVKPSKSEILALDIESLNENVDISLDDARIFLLRVHESTGRMPMIYGNHAVVSEISKRFGADPIFSKTRLWYARFRPSIPDFPTATWPTYTLWQFSSEINCKPSSPHSCLYRVPGTGPDMDVNVCNATFAECRQHWPFD